MNNDSPPIVQGTASPPAKNDFKFRPVRAKSSPIAKTNAEKIKITEVSIIEFKLLVLVSVFTSTRDFAPHSDWHLSHLVELGNIDILPLGFSLDTRR